VLQFTEGDSYEGGGLLSVPNETGSITSLHFTAQTDTTTGQGPLIVSTPTTIVALNPIPKRSNWESIQFSTIAVLNRGFLSQYGTTNVNGDLWGRAIDGLRSFAMTQRQTRTWAHTPLSREMDRVLRKDTENLLEFSSSIYFDNRLLTTCSPTRGQDGKVYHRGIIALNFDNIASVGESSNPAYDGLWTGIQPYYLTQGRFNGQHRAFALARGSEGQTELWEISKEDKFDNGDVAIKSFIETPCYAFTNPILYKKLVGAELWVDGLEETVNFDVKYRPDQYPCWVDWHSWSICAPMRFCDTDFANCTMFADSLPQYRSKMQLPSPGETCDPLLKRAFRNAHMFQVRLAWEGPATFKQLRLYAEGIQDAPIPVCVL
jgi:hypothetical protein